MDTSEAEALGGHLKTFDNCSSSFIMLFLKFDQNSYNLPLHSMRKCMKVMLFFKESFTFNDVSLLFFSGLL